MSIITDEAAKELGTMAVNRGLLSDDNFKKYVVLSDESGQSLVSILFEKKIT